MKIIDKLSASVPSFSFEFFPPKNQEGMEQLFETVARLRPYEPTYVSVTYGAGGSTRELTVDLVQRIQRETGIEAMAHLTTVGHTRSEVRQILRRIAEAGIENVLPLRGDPPRGQTEVVATADGFAHAADLVKFIREEKHDFCLAGACYPEGHPEAPSREDDLAHLSEKVAAGVDFLITQLFFDCEDYFGFVERARAAGIQQKILPGIMPITNLAQIKRFTAMCGAKIPPALLQRLEAAGAAADEVRAIGVEHATLQCRELLDRGAPGIHFYTLNRSRATVEILEAIR